MRGFANRLLAVLLSILILAPCALFAAAQKLPDSAPNILQKNVNYDFSHVYDHDLAKQLSAALLLGYHQAAAGQIHVGAEIKNLQGNGNTRTISFFSDPNEANPGGAAIGAPAFCLWTGPLGLGDMDSAIGLRSDLRVYVAPGQPYWYVTSNLWHELLHLTLRITHHQTTPEGTMPAKYVNDSVWYSTIKQIMFDFPRNSTDPISGQPTELYNPENNPWS